MAEQLSQIVIQVTVHGLILVLLMIVVALIFADHWFLCRRVRRIERQIVSDRKQSA